MEEATWHHIHHVQKLIMRCQRELISRALEHDQSKLSLPEVDVFAQYNDKLRELEYGSPEYIEQLKTMKQALRNHYSINRHHPEHFKNGINDMNLIDLMEMLCDWVASSTRSKNGDINKSLEVQRTRFGISEQLLQVMRNTVNDYLVEDKKDG